MNKSELIDSIAKKADLSRAQAASALNAVTGSITKAVSKGEKVQLTGFGTFEVQRKQARIGRHPRTSMKIKIPAKKVARFRAGKALRDSIK